MVAVTGESIHIKGVTAVKERIKFKLGQKFQVLN
jgi:hypothetical protein